MDTPAPSPQIPPVISSSGPVVVTTPVNSNESSSVSTTTAGNYASFGRRLVAVLLDGFILGTINVVLTIIFSVISVFLVGQSLTTGGSTNSFGSFQNLQTLNPAAITMWILQVIIELTIGIGYPVYFIGSKGQTPGKMALGIKVVKVDGGSVPGFGSAFLREVIGKLLSGLLFALGYLWMLWDNKKQTWHDKISGTVVVRI